MVFGKKSLSYLEFFNSHLYPEMEDLKAMVVQKWNNVSNEMGIGKESLSITPNDKDLNLAMYALLEPIIHSTFDIMNYAVGKLVFQERFLQIGLEKGWFIPENPENALDELTKLINVWEKPMASAATAGAKHPAHSIMEQLVKTKVGEDGASAVYKVIAIPLEQKHADVWKKIRSIVQKSEFNYKLENPEDQELLAKEESNTSQKEVKEKDQSNKQVVQKEIGVDAKWLGNKDFLIILGIAFFIMLLFLLT